MAGWVPDWSVPPGETLREKLEELGLSQSELARRMDRPQKTINEIVNGKARLTPDTALQLEQVLGAPKARFWNMLQLLHDEYLARQRAAERANSLAIAEPPFPLGVGA